MNRDLARVPLSQIPGRPLCTNCHHTRASHGHRGTRCWAGSCTCPGYLAPDVAP